MNEEIIDNTSITALKNAIEALLFISGDGLTVSEIANGLNQKKEKIQLIVDSLVDDFIERGGGIILQEAGGKYQFKSSPVIFEYIKKFIGQKKTETLSKSMLEVLAIIAYKQPITRFEIDELRGTKSNAIILNLMQKKVIKINGYKDVPGKPPLYSTTKDFLQYFGLATIDDLPPIQELKEFNFEDL